MPAQANLTRDEARTRAAHVRDVEVAVHLDLTGDGPTYPSSTTLRFAATPGLRTFLDLQAAALQRLIVNGEDRSATAAEAYDGTRVALEGLAADNEVTVVADCRYEHSGVGLHRFVDPVDGAVYLHTQFEPYDANRVYACFDQPDLKVRFTLTVDAPEDMTVVSNTTARRAGTRWTFAPTLPISTYLTALVAGPLHAAHDVWTPAAGGEAIPLGLYCRASLAEHLDADEFFTITKQGLDYFSARFSAPYPFGSYDQLLVPEFNWGAMENAGCVTFSESYVFRSRVTEAARHARASTILHEMAHMWFGDLVTMRWWDDLWLNESFATYMGTRALAEATRFTDAWASFSWSMKNWALAQDQLPSTHPIAADIVDTDAVRTNFDGITYAKGAAVLKQLVAWVGDEAFFSGLAAYFEEHAFGNATLTDFLDALAAPSGRDLASWSALWLETAGVATLRPALTAASGKVSALAVRQEPPEAYPTVRPHRLAVGCYDTHDGALVRSRRVELDLTDEQVEVAELHATPVPDLLLVNDDDLAFGKLRLDPGSLATLASSLGSLADPLARTLCWGAAWDMTRDGELAARRFVELVAAHAPAESSVDVLTGLLRQALTAADRYGDPGHRPTVLAHLSAQAAETLAALPAASDEQLVWVRARAGAALRSEELSWVAGVLDGEVSIDGLVVDTDLRWALLATLAAGGWADEARIDAELALDPTDVGQRRAAAARAARPEPAAKQAAWALLVDPAPQPLALRRAVGAAFWQVGQEDLLAPYLTRFTTDLTRVWQEHNPEEALSLTGALYPSTVITDEVVAAADRVLAGQLPTAARRIVAEQRDATLRALRAREVDAAAR